MNQNLKKMISYYKPYRAVFAADMLFATLSAAVALTIPLVVRYVTSTLIYQQPQMMLRKLFLIGIGLFVLLALDCYSRFFIGNYGHVMGAKMEYDMRAELFGHLQKLSFSFYDDAKVGQLMSRVTADLFDITELLHHGPENIILSVLKIVGAFVILLNINGWLALAAFAVLPVMFVFAFVLNKRMRRAFQQNRIKIAEINEHKLIRYNLELEHIASTDPLTGLFNRWQMYKRLETCISRYTQHKLQTLTVAMGDIDFFKHVNDTYGHDAGDEVLRTLSRLFRTIMDKKGYVCRWGGEEFLFLFPDMDMDEVQLLMSDLLDDIRHTPVLYERKLIHVTMTFGVEEFGRNHTMESVIQEADRKLYLGKESGRNRVIY